MINFKNLENALQKAKSPIVRYLNPGLPKDDILKYFQDLQMTPIKEVIDLYEWHNGINDEGLSFGVDFFGLKGFFIPISQIKECYQDRVDESWVVSNEPLGKYLLPISYDDDLMVCLKPNSRFLGAVYIISPALLILEPCMIFDSIETMVLGITEAHNLNLYSYDDDGFLLDFDVEKEAEVFKKLNPKSEFWKRDKLS